MAINLPEKCLRGRHDCEPWAQIEPEEKDSFICVGLNDGTTRVFPQDEFTMCWKNKEIDEYSHWDKRDLTDTASIILQALSISENIKNNKETYGSANSSGST